MTSIIVFALASVGGILLKEGLQVSFGRYVAFMSGFVLFFLALSISLHPGLFGAG